MAMPWKLAKAKAAAIRADTTGESLVALNRLFNACFRIQAEASLTAGRHIPLVVENVRGAQPWVGRARWHFGSFYLWGDVPALMPMTKGAMKRHPNDQLRVGVKVGGIDFSGYGTPGYKAQAFNTTAMKRIREDGIKLGGTWFHGKNNPLTISSSKSRARKFASAMIAKIPLILSRHIAATYRQ